MVIAVAAVSNSVSAYSMVSEPQNYLIVGLVTNNFDWSNDVDRSISGSYSISYFLCYFISIAM